MELFDIHRISKKFIWNKFTNAGLINKLIECDNYKIQFWDNDTSKEVLVLLHGFGVQAEFQWYRQIEELSKRYRVIMPNLLYFGDSKPLNQELFELQDQVTMIKSLINYLNIDKFLLAGISYGGLVSMEYCRQNDKKVKKLILIDSPVKYFGNEDLEQICKTYQVKSVVDFFAPKNYKGLEKQIKASYYQRLIIPFFITKKLYEKLCLPNINSWEKLIVSLLNKMDYYFQIEYSPDFPILLIWGEHDDIIPVSIGKRLEAYFKNCTLITIPKTKHMPNLESAKKFNKVFIDFLE